MNSPSYYYHYKQQRQVSNEQIDRDSDDGSLDQCSRQQHQEIGNYRYVNQQQSYQKNRYHRQKLNGEQGKSPQKIDHQYVEQKNDIINNPDRSLKMDKSNTKHNDLINKNKSLSTPSNNGIDTKHLFKKHKPPQNEDKTHVKNQKHPVNPKPSATLLTKATKPKIQKQKKISNGSLSTNTTKPTTTNKKKHKISEKKLRQQKKHCREKSCDSSVSNQFLVLGDELYDYEQVSHVPSVKHLHDKKSFLDEQKLNQHHKKVAFSSYNHQSISKDSNIKQLMSSMYDAPKLSRKLHNTIGRIEKYMMGFLEAQGYQQAKESVLQNMEELSLEEKLIIYRQLLRDDQLKRQLEIEKEVEQVREIDAVIRLAVEKVEKKTEKLCLLYKEEQQLISKWKNSKLHQLSTAKKILQKLVQEQHNHNNNLFISPSNSSPLNQLQQLPDPQTDILYLLQKQLQQIMSEQYYPQMKKHTLTLRKSITEILKNQKIPKPKTQTQTEITQRNKMEDTKNYFTPNGVLWFFEKFFIFIAMKSNYVDQLVDKLNQGYGFDVETKKVIAKTRDLEKWYSFFGEGQKSAHRKSLINDSIFQEFEEKIINTDPQLSSQAQKYMHHFNKAIIDAFNQQFHRVRPFYPYGEPIPNIEKPGKYFEITTDSVFYFIEKSKFHIYTNYITFFAGLILPEGQQENKETKKYNLAKQIKLVNQEMLYDWESYHCLLPVAKLATFDDLYQQIEREIYHEVERDILKIMLKR